MTMGREFPMPDARCPMAQHPEALGHQPSAIGYWPSAIGHRPSSRDHQPSAPGPRSSVICPRLSAVGHRPSVIGRCPSAVGHRSSVVGHWSSVIACGLLAAALALPGCVRLAIDDGPFTIATTWTEAERKEVETEFSRWLSAKHGGQAEVVSIEWVPLGPGEDLERVLIPPKGVFDLRPHRFDVALGGPASSYVKLSRMGRLGGRPDREGRQGWRVVRRRPIGLAVSAATSPSDDRGLAFDDPRHDPVALAWAKGKLGAGNWAEGYARLVRDAGHSPRIRRQAGSALAAVERGEASQTPAVEPGGPDPARTRFVPVERPPEWVEGVAAGLYGDHKATSELFFQFLAERGQAEPPAGPVNPDADDLLADLLGATLVDAQDELRAAWRAREKAGRVEQAEGWMTEPPPWPPASVEKLLARQGSADLLDTLARQVAPDAGVRAWLTRSWLAPRRNVDGKLLEELAGAADGRLVREPRFRAWLRAEWTAWARQRYRRVTRVVEGRWP
jgi:hypothetical protein